ncbi:hypothetical protein FF1_020462 [Malus domestica]
MTSNNTLRAGVVKFSDSDDENGRSVAGVRYVTKFDPTNSAVCCTLTVTPVLCFAFLWQRSFFSSFFMYLFLFSSFKGSVLIHIVADIGIYSYWLFGRADGALFMHSSLNFKVE